MIETIDTIFDYLDEWRHLPSYQLERRADIFFAAFLPRILESRFRSVATHVIPEFPLHIPTIDKDYRDDLSFKVDYLAILPDPAAPVFVELKTDKRSNRAEQDSYLLKAAEARLPALIRGIGALYGATRAKRKYDALLRTLEKAGLITVHGPGSFEVHAPEGRPSVVFIQPTPETGREVIDFTEIAHLLEGEPDPLARRFAVSLLVWAKVNPGDTVPAA